MGGPEQKFVVKWVDDIERKVEKDRVRGHEAKNQER